ncbi:MobA/MobL family protein [Qiania dongpingensis]|uniref:MobA/MobL family protein n=2 Tax=Qiania dongpingensis TaxID=2763669 RepID=A0A7G9G884_9FIRM|nr:MobA/MobL family protein [Qiania dongpingensis]
MGRYSPQTPSEPQVTEHPLRRLFRFMRPNSPARKEVATIAIYHCTIKIIKRSEGRSAVAAAAYRSGQKLTNEWDGHTHDYTRKGGIVHSEIILPAHAPPTFSDRSTLWNSVEAIEKSGKSQLARELEIALPAELDREAQLALVRTYVRNNFVSAGMCADFALHDKGDGNPHAHIMLTMRPLTPGGEWGAKCRKEYDLDERGQRIPDGKGGWKNHRADTTDWNDRDKAEQWRAAWAEYANRALEQANRPERIDHRSYKRQGVEQLPTVHMGVAATRMERRGIVTDKGNINRQIAADNKLLKEIKARMTRLYNWTKEEASKPQGRESVMAQLWQARQEMSKPATRTGKVKALQESAALFNFLQGNGITSMQELHEKIAAMNSAYYNQRGEIVSAERRIAALTERLEMWAQYEKYKHIRRQLDSLKPSKQEKFAAQHGPELALFDTAARQLKDLTATGEAVTPKQWRAEADTLTAKKDVLYQEMRAMREEIKAVEGLRKAAEQLAKTEAPRKERENDR